MKPITAYLRQIQKIKKKLSAEFPIKAFPNGIEIAGQLFVPVNRNQFTTELLSAPEGILARDLMLEEIRYLEAQRVSYLTLKGSLRLFKNGFDLRVEPQKRNVRLRPRISLREEILSPTLLLSPNGFKILDVLFRLPAGDLRHYKSALGFANQFGLNQPRISKLMRLLKVRSVYDLRKAISDLPDAWWEMAFRDKRTQKKITPFFVHSKPHYSLLPLSSREIAQQLKDWESVNSKLIPGPLEVAKGLGFLRDEDISFWGSPEVLHALKTKFKLIPGVNKERPVWQLATPKNGEAAEAVATQINFSPINKENMPIFSRANTFRAIWDLGFGTERLKELQVPIVRGVISGV